MPAGLQPEAADKPTTGPIAPARPEHFDRARLSLLIYHADGAEMVPLPLDVPVVIGREAPSDMRFPDPTLSRAHARFLYTRGVVIVEDLGSTNGTWVGGKRVTDPVELKLSDEVMLGSLVTCVHALGPTSGNLGLESEERFRRRLDDEVVRARHFRGRFALMLVRAAIVVSAAEDAAGFGGAAALHVGRWAPGLRAVIRAVDHLALYSPDAVQIFLPDIGYDAARAIADAIAQCPSAGDPRLFVGLALYPDAATAPDKLIELSRGASAAATVDRPVGVAPMATWVSGHARALEAEAPIIAGSALREVLETADRLAKSKVPVILHGETGTGKEVLARRIHERGPRRSAPMVCVNCGAIAKELVESTFFGHERGAFTGASQQQKGVFEEANGGTVFLDEIGELPLAAQAALLRVLETGTLTRVGSNREIAVDVRVIAATHRDLAAMCREAAFRDDLYYRMSTITLTIPPLRNRQDEIEGLAARFVRLANAASRGQVTGVDPRALALLRSYAWPGNVRELRNAIERAVIVARGELISESDLPARVRASRPDTTSQRPDKSLHTDQLEPPPNAMQGPASTGAVSEGPETRSRIKEKLLAHEKRLIVEALAAVGWNQTHAAKLLKMPLRTLQFRMKALRIQRGEP